MVELAFSNTEASWHSNAQLNAKKGTPVKITKSLVSLLAAVSLTTLAACSQSEGDNGEKSADATTEVAANEAEKTEDSSTDSDANAESNDSEDESANADAKTASIGGSYEATVDGQAIVVEDETIVCQEAAGTMNLAVGSGTAGISAMLSTDDNPTVKGVGMMDADGNTLAYAEGSPMGSATATKEGDSYTVSGEGIVTDPQNPTSMETKPFELKITCG
ncbi:hypothetical protein FNY97_03930 [Corynebacterium hiratae]|uniref:Lipoprotein LpqH n=2 Tax=Corynebacterium TaxID=1716 RepID=A0A2N6TQ98_9CORY|nr:hypothetical protein CJ201_04680 [Corynebacterium aurimucosum]TRX63061.1 hypothetical protein FNY97_03930 [Corynebacterium aurimucosum]